MQKMEGGRWRNSRQQQDHDRPTTVRRMRGTAAAAHSGTQHGRRMKARSPKMHEAPDSEAAARMIIFYASLCVYINRYHESCMATHPPLPFLGLHWGNIKNLIRFRNDEGHAGAPSTRCLRPM